MHAGHLSEGNDVVVSSGGEDRHAGAGEVLVAILYLLVQALEHHRATLSGIRGDLSGGGLPVGGTTRPL